MKIPISEFFIESDIRQAQKGIVELAMDIKAHGLLLPLLVQVAENGEFEILDGRRRFFAMRDHLEYSEFEENIHFIVKEGLHAKAVQYAANANREDFTPIEKALLIKEIHEDGIAENGPAMKSVKTGGWTMADTAKVINRDKGFVSKMLKVASVPKGFDDCKTIQECFNLMSKRKKQAITKKIGKAKVEKAKVDIDVVSIMNSIKCSKAEAFVPLVEDSSIDLIHIDPPFAIDYDEMITTDQYDADYEDDPDEVMNGLRTIIPHFSRVLKNNRYCIVWCGWKQSFEVTELLEASGFTVLPSPLVWMKLSTAGKTFQPHIRPGSATLFAVVAWQGTPELSIKGRHNYFPYPIIRKNRIHQAQMPEALVMDIIRIFSSEGDKVLDCYAGSLVTLRACFSTNRNFIGCEMQQQNIENGMSVSIDWIKAKQEQA
jgi:ParB/RepB/Spo0J family partition protein